MASDADPLPTGAGIKALPPRTVRHIGSSQVIVDSSSAVKELIDNALDARATGIFVDIHTDAISSIQVKDNGHGIPAVDRPLVCRRHCTSKIRDFHDLRQIGGKWLGFRGEAMASMAELSEALHVTTRVEGEPVALFLQFGRNGELESTARASHSVGTTAKVTNLFHTFPVRKQDALKHSAKWLAKIRRIMQAYALARPTVRFQLRVMKAKTEKGNFNYAPKPGANVEDAAFKVIGRDCASQCEWAVFNSDDFEILAFLPKPEAIAAKIANHGAFLSVDARPVAVTHGTMKKVSSLVREKMRTSNPAFALVRDPFFCMNIVCPADSYDPNIEPAKDNVLFDNETVVLKVVGNLLSSFYPEVVSSSKVEHSEPSLPEMSSQSLPDVDICADAGPSYIGQQDSTNAPKRKEARWRPNMYGTDEEDLALISSEPPRVIVEEEEAGAAGSYNPWTIAKINAAMKSRKPATEPKLMTPAKSAMVTGAGSSSPLPSSSRAPPDVQLLTPHPSSQMNAAEHPLSFKKGQGRTTKHVRPLSPVGRDGLHAETASSVQNNPEILQTRLRASCTARSSSPFRPNWGVRSNGALQERDVSNFFPTNLALTTNMPHLSAGFGVSQPPQQPRRFSPRARVPVARSAPPIHDEQPDLWFGQPMRGTPVPLPPRTRKKPRWRAPRPFPTEANNTSVQEEARNQEERLKGAVTSANKTDIRDFFSGRKRKKPTHQRSSSLDSLYANTSSAPPFTSFTPVNPHAPFKPVHVHDVPRDCSLQSQLGQNEEFDASLDIGAALHAYAERELPPTSTQPQINKAFSLPRPRSAPHSETLDPVIKSSPLRSSSPTAGPSNYVPAPQYMRSSYLPLEHTPTSQNLQNLLLTVNLPLGIDTVQIKMHKLDMQQNSLEWGYPAALWAEDGWSAFAGWVSEEDVGRWVSRVVIMLDVMHEERCEGSQWDVENTIMEGVWRVVGRMQDIVTQDEAERQSAEAEDGGRADGSETKMENAEKAVTQETSSEVVGGQSAKQAGEQRLGFCGQEPRENIAPSTGLGTSQAVAYGTDDEFADKDLDEEMLLM